MCMAFLKYAVYGVIVSKEGIDHNLLYLAFLDHWKQTVAVGTDSDITIGRTNIIH